MSGMMEIAQASATITTNGAEAKTTDALWEIYLLGCAFPLMQDWSNQLTQDQLDVFKATLEVTPGNPRKSAGLSEAYLKYNQDEAEQQKEEGNQTSLVDKEKAVIQQDNGSNAYSLNEGIAEESRALKSIIMGF